MGVTLDDAWYCSVDCVELTAASRFRGDESEALSWQAPRLKLGSLLVHQRVISHDTLERALCGQRDSGLPLGSELQRLGVAQGAVLRALAAQEGVDYLTSCDVARVHDAPGGLHPDTARALGVVPFEADEEGARLKVACRAPIPRRSLEALRQLTGWIPEPFLVSEQVWRELISAYGRRRRAGDPPSTRCGPDAAAARVARLVSEDRAVRVQQARCDPFTWVRLEGSTGVEDLFVTRASKEEPCRPAPTSH